MNFTSEDIKNLTDYQALVFKDVFATKEDVASIKTDISRLQNTMDSFAKDNVKTDQELTVLSSRVNNTENWIKKVVPKVQVKFEQ